MGAGGSTQHGLDVVYSDVARQARTLKEMALLSYEGFLAQVEELNKISQTLPDSNGNVLIFKVQKGTDSTIFWKSAVRIACLRVNVDTGKVDSIRLLNLRQFLRAYHSLSICASAKSSTAAANPLSPSIIFEGLDEIGEIELECCICMERKPEVTLPCTHSYCLLCIEQWNVTNKTCPVCREKLDSTTESWVISEAPDAAEVDAELKKALSSLGTEQ